MVGRPDRPRLSAPSSKPETGSFRSFPSRAGADAPTLLPRSLATHRDPRRSRFAWDEYSRARSVKIGNLSIVSYHSFLQIGCNDGEFINASIGVIRAIRFRGATCNERRSAPLEVVPCPRPRRRSASIRTFNLGMWRAFSESPNRDRGSLRCQVAPVSAHISSRSLQENQLAFEPFRHPGQSTDTRTSLPGFLDRLPDLGVEVRGSGSVGKCALINRPDILVRRMHQFVSVPRPARGEQALDLLTDRHRCIDLPVSHGDTLPPGTSMHRSQFPEPTTDLGVDKSAAVIIIIAGESTLVQSDITTDASRLGTVNLWDKCPGDPSRRVLAHDA
jgi:hypothetical protein